MSAWFGPNALLCRGAAARVTGIALGLGAVLAGRAAAQTEQVVSSAFMTSFDPRVLPFQTGAAGVFDARRNRLVVFDAEGQIHEWDGSTWGVTLRLPGTATAAAHDPGRRTSWILVAPPSSSAVDLVEYDGRRVVDHGPAPGPGCLVMDTARSRLVWFGGDVSVHEWDGVAWRVAATTGGPRSVNSLMGVAFDAPRATSVVLVLVDDPVASVTRQETWEWNGATWTAWPGATTPAMPTVVELAFDPVGQRVIATPFSASRSTAAWAGGQWTQITARDPFPSPPAVLATDPRAGRVLRAEVTSGFVWSFDGAQWRSVGGPAHWVDGGAAVFDEQRRVLLAFDTYHGTITEWDSTRWSVSGSMPPSPSGVAAIVYDAARGETVLFGSTSATGVPSAETWAWNGSWRQVAGSGPPPRDGAPATFDRVRGRVVLVGGWDRVGFLHDQWEWDGAVWTQVNTVVPFEAWAVAQDEARNVLVAIGMGETWEWSGVWTRRLVHPGRGFSRGITYDASRRRVVATMITPTVGDALSEWDGTAWHDLGIHRGQLVFDRHRGVLLDYDHTRLVAITSRPSAAFEQGRGCGGAEEPSLLPFDSPRIGNRAFELDLVENAGGVAAAVVFSFAPQNMPLPGGCTALVGATAATTFGVTDAFGMQRTPLPIPDCASLHGVAVHAQAAVLAPSLPLGVALSAGLRLVVGD